jgi:[glutamine synthetase] adenylyltransferase / [glutamine synthetase]-adenylyl-L-tyrosine phosphorylase
VPLTAGQLARLGFQDTRRAQGFLADPVLAGGEGAATGDGPEAGPGQALSEELAVELSAGADPDLALLSLLRLAEAADAAALAGGARSSGLRDLLAGPSPVRRRLALVLGASAALGDALVRHPDLIGRLDDGHPLMTLAASPQSVRADLLRAVGADPDDPVPVASGPDLLDALRRAYTGRLLQIAAIDVAAVDPTPLLPSVAGALAQLADAALEAALAVARALTPDHRAARLAVVAMGKTGGRELNYISDVDVLYVVEPADGVDEEHALEVGTALARELARACSQQTSEGALWQVDANLRPEGKDGPLVRTLGSYRAYYRTWAKSWEFQALLKARAAAGDRELGQEFVTRSRPLVWQASTRDAFVEDSRAMRRRVVANIPVRQADRHLKLGEGGLRDVEFTVQLLQMVHGRTDETVRSPTTLVALAQLRDGGYVGRHDAERLDEDYRLLRVVEHRLQLHRLRRGAVLPTGAADLRRLARGVGVRPRDFETLLDRTRREVRDLHTSIFYRPLLTAAAGLPDEEVSLTPDGAAGRLEAIGYVAPQRALEHVDALTRGLSRRAAIARQLMPAMLHWISEGTDPDMGLLAYRRLSEEIGTSHWYMGTLRDSGAAAQRLARVLSTSRFVGEAMLEFPTSVTWLTGQRDLVPRTSAQLRTEVGSLLTRLDDVDAARQALRRFRRRELLRVALGMLLDRVGPAEAGRALADVATAVLEAALRVAAYEVAGAPGDGPVPDLGIEMAVLALGSYGAGEMGFSSDADVQFVHRDTGAGAEAAPRATAVANSVIRLLNGAGPGPDMRVNADLRPEGRSGPVARSLDGWTAWYRTQAARWEKQALLRATVVLGPEGLRAAVTAVLDEVRYPAAGISASEEREVRRMKARVESERLPRGVEPTRHLKLGRGAMTDVEWVVQLLQMRHAGADAALRVTGTLAGLEALAAAGLVTAHQHDVLAEAWRTAWRMRRATFLWKGRESEVLPKERSDLRGTAAIALGPGTTAAECEEQYLRATRQARVVVEELFFGKHPEDPWSAR